MCGPAASDPPRGGPFILYADGGWRARRVGWAWVAIAPGTGAIVDEASGSIHQRKFPWPGGSYSAELYAVMQALESRYAREALIRTDARAIEHRLLRRMPAAHTPMEARVFRALRDARARIVFWPRRCDEGARRADALASRSKATIIGRRRHRRRG